MAKILECICELIFDLPSVIFHSPLWLANSSLNAFENVPPTQLHSFKQFSAICHLSSSFRPLTRASFRKSIWVSMRDLPFRIRQELLRNSGFSSPSANERSHNNDQMIRLDCLIGWSEWKRSERILTTLFVRNLVADMSRASRGESAITRTLAETVSGHERKELHNRSSGEILGANWSAF
jgi:hypothetical protein